MLINQSHADSEDACAAQTLSLIDDAAALHAQLAAARANIERQLFAHMARLIQPGMIVNKLDWTLAKKSLSNRVHECKSCGHTEPRDLASASTALRWALQLQNTGQELATPSFAQAGVVVHSKRSSGWMQNAS